MLLFVEEMSTKREMFVAAYVDELVTMQVSAGSKFRLLIMETAEDVEEVARLTMAVVAVVVSIVVRVLAEGTCIAIKTIIFKRTIQYLFKTVFHQMTMEFGTIVHISVGRRP